MHLFRTFISRTSKPIHLSERMKIEGTSFYPNKKLIVYSLHVLFVLFNVAADFSRSLNDMASYMIETFGGMNDCKIGIFNYANNSHQPTQ